MSVHSRLAGRDLHAPSNQTVENKSGVNIGALKVVRLDGMGTAFPKVAIADPNIYVNFGITWDAIANNKSGLVACFGFMFEVDTSAWPVFTNLYSDASGNLVTTPLGGIVAQVIKQDADTGILYVVTEQADSVNSVSWRLEGNTGTNPAINFLGTIDSQPLRIRTNNLQRATIDDQGRFGLGPDILAPLSHFHQKSHVGFAGSGLQQSTFSVITNSNTNEVIYTIPINQNSVVKVEINILGRISDGSGRAAFKRSGLFYRQGSNVQAQRVWQTDFTDKSDNGFNVSYTMGVSELVVYVKSAAITTTYWTGSVQIEALETDT